MPTVEAGIVIHRPLADVFAYVEEWSNATEFTESLVSWQPVSDVVDGVGAQFHAVMRVGPTTQESTLEIVRREQDAEIAWESLSGFEQKGGYVFAAHPDGTEVTFRMELTLPGGIAGRLLGRVIEPFAKQNTAATLGNLKRVLEDC